MSRTRKAACQRTLKAPIGCSGIGLHSGSKVSITLNPAPPGHGIVFRRTDLTGDAALIAADWRNVVDTQLCTAIGNAHGARVSTIEHLMAALYGCEIDNALIDIDGPEAPIMDGSSAPFVFLIECAGAVDQAALRRGVKILREVEVVENDCRLTISPAASFSIDFEIDFQSAAVARQACALDVAPTVFRSDLARARTFGFMQDIGRLQAAGLARGGSLDNAVVVNGDKIMNDDGLRFDDEFVRHKILDCVGDLYLAGMPLVGRVHGRRSGHRHNNKLLRALFADTSTFRVVELVDGAAEATAPAEARAVALN